MIVTLLGLIALWWLVVAVTGVPRFILPGPGSVLATFGDQWALLARHAAITLAEILAGLVIGTVLGVGCALALAWRRTARRWLLPLIVASQAIPVFALAPLLVLWLGYGMASKIAMASLIIFFPVAAAFHDGLRRVDPAWIEMARVMGASSAAILLRVRLPAALPALASGLKVATAVAPIGAVVGEWVGSSEGLGYLMLHANARMKTDLMFAALLTLAVMAVGLHWLVDRLTHAALPWQPDTNPFDDSDQLRREDD